MVDNWGTMGTETSEMALCKVSKHLNNKSSQTENGHTSYCHLANFALNPYRRVPNLYDVPFQFQFFLERPYAGWARAMLNSAHGVHSCTEALWRCYYVWPEFICSINKPRRTLSFGMKSDFPSHTEYNYKRASDKLSRRETIWRYYFSSSTS